MLQFNIFLVKLRTRLLLTNVYKSVYRIFLKFYLDLELFAEIKKDLVSTHFFALLLITQDPVENVCKILAKNIKLYGSWSSSKFSIFQTKTWFLGNNRGLP